MYAFESDRKKSYAALDLMMDAGSVDLMLPIRELMNRRPELTEKEARNHVSGWYALPERSKIGLSNVQRRPDRHNRRAADWWMHEFDDFRPIGTKKCPNNCNDGYLIKSDVEEECVYCEMCKGKGYVPEEQGGNNNETA